MESPVFCRGKDGEKVGSVYLERWKLMMYMSVVDRLTVFHVRGEASDVYYVTLGVRDELPSVITNPMGTASIV